MCACRVCKTNQGINMLQLSSDDLSFTSLFMAEYALILVVSTSKGCFLQFKIICSDMNLKKEKIHLLRDLFQLMIMGLKRHLKVIYSLPSIQIRRVREMTAVSEMCPVMINSPPDSRRCLCHCVEPLVAMSYYPHPANGRRRQIIHLP